MKEILKQEKFEVAPEELRTWQGRKEWFFNRDDTDHYEQYYEGPYKFQEGWQKKTLEGLIKQDTRVKTLLEFGCGTTRFTRWWHEIGLEATGGDISPFMLAQGVQLFDGDLVLADSHHMPFKDHSFDALAFVTTFEYYKNPVQVIREAVRVGKYGIIFRDDEPKHSQIDPKKGAASLWKKQLLRYGEFLYAFFLERIDC